MYECVCCHLNSHTDIWWYRYLTGLTGISDVAVRPSEQYLAGVPAILWPPRVGGSTCEKTTLPPAVWIEGALVRERERIRKNSVEELNKMDVKKYYLNREDNNLCICSHLRWEIKTSDLVEIATKCNPTQHKSTPQCYTTRHNTAPHNIAPRSY